MGDYQLKIVKDKKWLKAFIDFPYQLYKDSPNWVPPIKSQYKAIFNKKKNPFFETGDMALFVLLKDNLVVGRIAAIENFEHNRIHQDKLGFFGFFECRDNIEEASLLIQAAKNYLHQKGKEGIRGPLSPSINHEAGFLVEGFEDAPRLMMPYTKAYYPKLMEALGFQKVKQLWAFKISSKKVAETAKIKRIAALIQARNKVTLREINMKQFEKEIQVIVDIYNKCWADNWGFVPISNAAALLMAKSMKPIVEKSLILIAEIDDKPVGMIVTLYDYNEIIIKMKGQLFPFGVFHLLNAKKKINWLRMMLIGVLPAYRKKGIDALLYYQSAVNALKLNMEYCEGSWTLEDNQMINQLASMMGGYIYKRYNIYEEVVV